MRKEAGGSVGGVLPIDREGFILNSPGPQLPVLRQSRVVGGRRGPGSGQRHSLRDSQPLDLLRAGPHTDPWRLCRWWAVCELSHASLQGDGQVSGNQTGTAALIAGLVPFSPFAYEAVLCTVPGKDTVDQSPSRGDRGTQRQKSVDG